MQTNDRLAAVENRLGKLEDMVQIVIDGGAELDASVQTGFSDLKTELDRQHDIILKLRRQMLGVRPRTIFLGLLGGFFVWCMLLLWMHR